MEPPWSNNQLRRLGQAIRDDTELSESLPDYGEVVAWYDDLAASVQRRIASLRLERTPHVAEVEISSRAKTIGTLRDKLRRERGLQLPSIQDVAGIRVTADMSLSRQDEVVRLIAAEFGNSNGTIRDIRNDPHSGYRAVHLLLRKDEGRAEVQVRTRLQSGWANAYEALADLAGRQIRYGGEPTWDDGLPDEVLSAFGPTFGNSSRVMDFPEALRWWSTDRIAPIELARNLAETWHQSRDNPDVATLVADDEQRFSALARDLQQKWERHPYADRDFEPRVDFSRPDASHHFHLLVKLLSDADARMLDKLTEMLVRYRAEIRKEEP